MDFYDKLYVSPSIRKPRQVRQDLERGKGHLRVYVLVLAQQASGRHQLEILHCSNLQSAYYRAHPPFIVGLAEGRQDAIELVRSIVDESFHMTGQWDAAEYLASHPGIRDRLERQRG